MRRRMKLVYASGFNMIDAYKDKKFIGISHASCRHMEYTKHTSRVTVIEIKGKCTWLCLIKEPK